MTSPSSGTSSGALEAVERILNRGGEPDDVLRRVVDALHERTGAWIAVAPGPGAGGAEPPAVQRHAVVWEGETVAELRASADADEALLARVAVLVSPHCRRAES